MYFNRLVPTKLLKYTLIFLVGAPWSSVYSVPSLFIYLPIYSLSIIICNMSLIYGSLHGILFIRQLGWLFPLSDLQFDFDSFASFLFLVLRSCSYHNLEARSIMYNLQYRNK